MMGDACEAAAPLLIGEVQLPECAPGLPCRRPSTWVRTKEARVRQAGAARCGRCCPPTLSAGSSTLVGPNDPAEAPFAPLPIPQCSAAVVTAAIELASPNASRLPEALR